MRMPTEAVPAHDKAYWVGRGREMLADRRRRIARAIAAASSRTARSSPVSKPSAHNRSCTASVATLPAAPGA